MPTKKELEKEIKELKEQDKKCTNCICNMDIKIRMLETQNKELTKKLEKIKEWIELSKDENGLINSYDLRAIQSRLDNDSEED
tara:strand:- start:922 stop:1170 length:249 start_codon:yes stop_codon:yes gene_type:complete